MCISTCANLEFPQHTYDTIKKTMDILHIEKKGRLLNMWEHFYIHSLSAQKLQMNGTYTDKHNPIFDLIIKYIPHNNKSLTNSPAPQPPKKERRKSLTNFSPHTSTLYYFLHNLTRSSVEEMKLCLNK
jgi:hypothetical protein